MEHDKGTTDGDIGRPDPWTEGRYEVPGQPIDQSVQTLFPAPHYPEGPVSTPVTQRDYRFPWEPDASEGEEPRGGDAG